MAASENRETDVPKGSIDKPMELDAEVCYRIIESRDARFDGKFFTAVVTTGIYCRPICPARTPARASVRFYSCAAAAEAAGFRPCKRCRPETAPGTPAWNGTSGTVARGLRLIGEGYLDEHSIEELAGLLGMGARHLRRLFDEHVGAAPVAIAVSRRLHFASRLLRETSLPVTAVALGSGFGSVRRFNEAFRKVFAAPPSSMRSARASAGRARRSERPGVVLTLPYRPPYQWEPLIDFFRARSLPGVEEVTDRSYRRTIAAGGSTGLLEVRRLERGNALEARIEGIPPSRLMRIVERVRRMFDLDADPEAIGRHLARDPGLAPLVERLPGLRVPGFWDLFETLARAIVGQQVSVSGARTTVGRLAERYGSRVQASEDSALTLVFPSATRILEADLSSFGLPSARKRALKEAAHLVASGFDPGGSLETLVETLCALPGVGPWTANYAALRGAGEPDAFPESDLWIRKALRSLGCRTPAERAETTERWRPWRGYAAMYLWSRLTTA